MGAPRTLCRIAILLWGFVSVGCATEDAADRVVTQPPKSEVTHVSDASVVAEPLPSAITVAPSVGTHLDGDATGYRPRGFQPKQEKGKTIELVLRSTPPGATASIDGRSIGVTPTFWSGRADQQAHEFTFVKDGHVMARYRVVATHSGVVHGTLSPLQATEPPKQAAVLAPK